MITFMLVEQSIPMEVVAETTPEEIFAVTISALIPPIMAFLSLALKNSINRWLNIILSIFLILAVILFTGFELIPTAYLPSVIMIAIVQIVALVLIVWYAWKSKQKT